MITQKEYKNHKEEYWIGKKVRCLRKLVSGVYDIPEGTILKIESKWKGFDLRGLDVCTHCKIGRVISIRQVEPSALELLEIAALTEKIQENKQ